MKSSQFFLLRHLGGALLNLFVAMPEGFEYFPYSFKAWKSPSNPSKQNSFSQYCVRYLCVLWTAQDLFGLCYTGPLFTNSPRVRNSCGRGLQRPCQNRKVLQALTAMGIWAVLPAQCSARTQLTSMGIDVEVNGTLIPGWATFTPGLTHTQSPLWVT